MHAAALINITLGTFSQVTLFLIQIITFRDFIDIDFDIDIEK